MSTSVACAIKTLSDSMTQNDVIKLQNALCVPSGICQSQDVGTFLHQLSNWRGFDTALFFRALGNINPTFVPLAREIPWLSEERIIGERNSAPMARFVEMLREQLTFENWRDILLSQGHLIEEGTSSFGIFNVLIKACIVTNDFSEFSDILKGIKRNDVANLLRQFRVHFRRMTLEDFLKDFKREALKHSSSKIKRWNKNLREFVSLKFEKIEPILGSAVTVKLEDIYTPLTIIKYNPSKQEREECGKTEIDLLRETYEKGAENNDILLKLNSYDPNRTETWFLIGNPGCGKTWLCNHIALKFGQGKLSKFEFSLSIPCRNQGWHSLEESRAEKGQSVDSQCLQEWLELGMPLGAAWSEELAGHIVKTEGEGLLLLIDSVDEFTKSVPVERTILGKLLQRQTLAKSTLLVTSRPAAWNQVSTELVGVSVDAYYQVLGFSPANRDVYISKRLDLTQLKAFHRMLAIHEEISLLSLVPVNASLFTSLFQVSDSEAMSASSLTQLYSQLFLYLIRRQLSRMKLSQHAKAESLFHLNPGVLQCLYAIGEVAYLGVSSRQLTSTQKIPLLIEGEKSQDSECLGLVQVQVQKESGRRTEVWCFCHLTLQEFSGAVYLCSLPWSQLCLMARFMVSSREVFNVYRMVARFSCGLLACTDTASILVHMVFRHQLTHPVPYSDMPVKVQMNCLDVHDNLNKTSGWYEFSVEFASFSTLIGECHLTPLYKQLNRHLPATLSFYFPESVPLNDWNNFLSFLPHITRPIEVIYLHLKWFTPDQLSCLLHSLCFSCVRFLSLFFVELEVSTLQSFCDVISQSPPLDTRLSIEIQSLSLSAPFTKILTSTNLMVSNLSLYQVELSKYVVKALNHSISSLQCLDICPAKNTPVDVYYSLVDKLSSARQLQGLHLDFPAECSLSKDLENSIVSTFDDLTRLREISCRNLILVFSILPKIEGLSELTQLTVFPTDTGVIENMTHTLHDLVYYNSFTLRVLALSSLHNLGFHTLNSLLEFVGECTGLVQLDICHSYLSIESECESVPLPNSLVRLHLKIFPLDYSSLIELRNRLAFHPSLRSLKMESCDLSPSSCQCLTDLIPTLSSLARLNVSSNKMNTPGNTTEIDLLSHTASLYSVELLFSKVILTKQISNYFYSKYECDFDIQLGLCEVTKTEEQFKSAEPGIKKHLLKYFEEPDDS